VLVEIDYGMKSKLDSPRDDLKDTTVAIAADAGTTTNATGVATRTYTRRYYHAAEASIKINDD
jgi:hypothetical protein